MSNILRAFLIGAGWLAAVGCNQSGGRTFSLPPGVEQDAGVGGCTFTCLMLLGLLDASGPICMQCNFLVLPDGGPGVLCDHTECTPAPGPPL